MRCTLPTFSCLVSCIPLPPASDDPAHDQAASQIVDEDVDVSDDDWSMKWSDDGEFDEDWDADEILEVECDEILEVKKPSKLMSDSAKRQKKPGAEARHHKFGTRINLELVA